MPDNERNVDHANADDYPERMTEYYFAYGSNMFVDQMKSRAPGSEFLGRGWLHDHSLQFSCVADVEAGEGHKVPGVIWKIEDHDDWRCLDRCEGYPNTYGRKLETVEVCCNLGYVDAWVYYIEPNGTRHPSKRVCPDESYARKLKCGYEQAGWARGENEFRCLTKKYWPSYTERVVARIIENSN